MRNSNGASSTAAALLPVRNQLDVLRLRQVRSCATVLRGESVVSVLDLLQSKLPSCGTERVVTDSQVFCLLPTEKKEKKMSLSHSPLSTAAYYDYYLDDNLVGNATGGIPCLLFSFLPHGHFHGSDPNKSGPHITTGFGPSSPSETTLSTIKMRRIKEAPRRPLCTLLF